MVPSIAAVKVQHLRNERTLLATTMLSFILPFALLCALFALIIADRNPCHPGRYNQGKDVSCEVVSIPPQLCTKCKLRPLGYAGNFRDCKKIYNLDDFGCRAELRRYASMNKCDRRRNLQVRNFNSYTNRIALDYFVYAVCEECCDCIPRGTNRGDYDRRKRSGTLLKVDRANCPAHAHYDICRVFPNIRYVKSPFQKNPSNLSKFPKVCPIFKKWKFGPNGQNLYNKSQVYIPYQLRRFLSQFMSAAKCTDRSLWNQCLNLEKSQKRV